jgi:hypothetical protein
LLSGVFRPAEAAVSISEPPTTRKTLIHGPIIYGALHFGAPQISIRGAPYPCAPQIPPYAWRTHIRTYTHIYTQAHIGLKRIDMIAISIKTWGG